jgi:hypothetical protein
MSNPKRGLPKKLAARGTRARGRQLAAAAAYFDERDERQERYRTATLRRLSQDKDFLLETVRVKESLLKLVKINPTLFRTLFRRLTPLILMNRSHVKKLLREVGNGEARGILRDYVRYTSRFKVRMVRTKRSFRPQPFDPPEGKFHARIVDGRLHPARGEKPREAMYEYLFLDEAMSVVPELEELIECGHARFLTLDDADGSSLLSEIEHFGYQPSGLTFIVHKTHHPRVYLLIGENLSTENVLGTAGKVLTALQKALFGKKKSGRPTSISRLKKAIRASRLALPPKHQAFQIEQKKGTATALETDERYLRRVKAHLNPRRSR